jgi:pre-mRNA 3'-end-processing factor FIP1
MADEAQEDEEWLYGENVSEDQIKIDPETAKKLIEDDNEDDSIANTNEADDNAAGQEGDEGDHDGKDDEDQANEGPIGSDEDVEDDDNEDDDDSDDDGVQVVIGDLKSGTPGTFSKRGGPPPDKKGKFSVEDFETPGSINGVSVLEYSVDSLEDKPWRKPGADITDYFNYGFTEDTWRAYCERQKRLRFESGAPMSNTMAKMHGDDIAKLGTQSNIMFPKKFNQQPYQRMQMKQEPQENTIQVRVVNTVDRRDNFGRKGYDIPNMGPPMGPPPFDISVPPPAFRPEYMGQPPPEFFNRPPPGFYHEPEMPGYEEQQWMDSQWEMGGAGVGASSSVSVVPLTKVPILPPPPGEADDHRDGK